MSGPEMRPMLIAVTAWLAAAPASSSIRPTGESSGDSVAVVGRVVGETSCKFDGVYQLQILLQVTLENTSNEPLIVRKGRLDVLEFEVRQKAGPAFAGSWHHPAFFVSEDPSRGAGKPPTTLFAVIPPGDSLKMEAEFGLGDEVERGSAEIRVTLGAWGNWTEELGTILQARWKRYGRLWTGTVATSFLPWIVRKGDPRPCSALPREGFEARTGATGSGSVTLSDVMARTYHVTAADGWPWRTGLDNTLHSPTRSPSGILGLCAGSPQPVRLRTRFVVRWRPFSRESLRPNRSSERCVVLGRFIKMVSEG